MEVCLRKHQGAINNKTGIRHHPDALGNKFDIHLESCTRPVLQYLRLLYIERRPGQYSEQYNKLYKLLRFGILQVR